MSPTERLSALAVRVFGTVSPERVGRTRAVLYVTSGAGAAFHARMWAPYVEAVDPNYVIAVPSPQLYVHLRRRHRDLPVVLLRSGRAVAEFVAAAPQLRAVLYTSHATSVMDVVRHEQLRHVFIGHGDSDKATSVHRAIRLYDEIWVAGHAQIDRLNEAGNLGPNQSAHVVGRPTARQLISQPDRAGGGPIGIMPTWEGVHAEHDYCSVPLLRELIVAAANASGDNIVVKLHPWTGNRDSSLSDAERDVSRLLPSTVPVTFEERSVPAETIMAQSAMLVTDVSSVAVDYLLTGRPLFVYLPDHLRSVTHTGAIEITDYAYTFDSAADLEKQVRKVHSGEDALTEGRDRMRNYLIDISATVEYEFERRLGDLLGMSSQPRGTGRSRKPDP